MNRTRYRIVFNRARGVLMAVAEHASAQGKSPGSTPTAAGPGLGAHPALQTFASTLASALVTLCLTLGNLPSAHAQIIASPSAPANQRPTVLQDSTGRPLVNIQTPSAASVSRNTYSQFDVQSKGAVLNNARASNPWLATGEAKVILNEVKSTNPSYLGGAITVQGTRAQVVIANPAGIKVDGASFVNASRATLTTGTPVIGTNGALTGLDVRQGTVEVTAKGLNVKGVSYTDILSRAATIAGRIDGNATDELNIITGAQTVDYATGQLTAGTATGTKPTVAIDTAALGGMYAGKITLLATEAGTGVRNAGTLKASSSGQLIVTADGRLENTGTLNGGITSVATVSGNIDNSGTLLGSKLLVAHAGADFTHSGAGMDQGSNAATVLVSAGRDIKLSPNAQIVSTTKMTAGGVVTQGQVALNADRDIQLGSGSIVAGYGSVQLNSQGKLVATGAKVHSKGETTALAAQGITLSNTNFTGSTVHLETGAPFVETSADISIAGGTVKGEQMTAAIATGNLTVSSPGATALSSTGDVYLRAGKNLTVAAGTTSTAGRHYTAVAGGALALQGAAGSTATNGRKVSLSAAGDLSLSGGSVSLSGSQLSATGALNIEATETTVGMAALAHAGGSAHERVQLSAGQDLAVSAYRGGISASGLVASGHKVSLLSQGYLSIRHVDNVLGAGHVQALRSEITARQDLTVGSVGANQLAVILASSLSATGKLTLSSQGQVLLLSAVNVQPMSGGGTATTSATTQLTGQHVAVQGGSAVIQGTQAQATQGHLSVTATQGDVELAQAPGGTGANLSATGNTALHANGQLKLTKAIMQAGGSLALTSASTSGGITAVGAVLNAGGMLSASSKGPQSHTGGHYRGGALSIYNEAGTLDLRGTRLSAVATQSAPAATFSGQLSLESGGALLADGGTGLSAATNLSIVTGAGHITITPDSRPSTASGLVLSQSQIGFSRNLLLQARQGDLTLAGAGSTRYASTLQVEWDSPGTITLAGRNVTLEGSQLSARRGMNVIATDGKLSIRSNAVDSSDIGYNTWRDAILSVDEPPGTGYPVTLNLRASGDIDINSAMIRTTGQLNLTSGGNTIISNNIGTTTWVDPDGGRVLRHYIVDNNRLIGTQGVNIEALGGHLVLNATEVHAQRGTVSLQALGDIVLEAPQEYEVYDKTSVRVKRTWYGKKKTTTTHVHNESLVSRPVWLDGYAIDLKAGGSVNTYATQFSATDRLRIEAGDEANYYGMYDRIYMDTTVKRTSSLLGVKYAGSKSHHSRMELTGVPAVLISKGRIESYSGGDQLLQGTVVISGAETVYEVGVGDKARTDARIKLEGLKSTVTESRTRESNYTVWQKQSGQGSTIETLVLPKFTGPAAPVFKGPVLAQIPAGDFKTQVQSLSQQPGMGYLTTLSQRTDVNWQPVKLAHEQWSYKQQGLTPAGAALLGVAVAWVSGGAGADLLGSITGSAPGQAAAAAANAAFISLSSQAAITLVNNGGDIGKTLKDLGKSDTVKAALAAALTAGVLDKIGALDSIQPLKESAAFTDKLTLNLINAGGRALTNTAVNGGSLEDALKDAILGGIVDTAHGEVASRFKVLEADYVAHKLAHALAGCVAGAAAQGTCKDGAIGAAVGEMVAKLMPPANDIAYSDSEKAKVLAYSKIIAGATSAFAGGNAQTAITTAETAVKNNALLPVLVGVIWLADKVWTAYDASQDIAAVRDGTKTVEQLALEKGDEYVTGIVLGNIARYGLKAVKVGGKWVQSKDNTFSNITESRSNSYTPNSGSVGNMKAFLDSPGFGSKLKDASQKSEKIVQGQSVYKAKIHVNDYIRAGDQFYLDGAHKNHIEVYDKNNRAKAVLNLDGSYNRAKTEAALSQHRTI